MLYCQWIRHSLRVQKLVPKIARLRLPSVPWSCQVSLRKVWRSQWDTPPAGHDDSANCGSIFLKVTTRALSEDHLKRWFWISGLRGDFYGSTMNYVAIACTDPSMVKECKVIPHGVSTFDKGMVKGLLRPPQRHVSKTSLGKAFYQ